MSSIHKMLLHLPLPLMDFNFNINVKLPAILLRVVERSLLDIQEIIMAGFATLDDSISKVESAVTLETTQLLEGFKLLVAGKAELQTEIQGLKTQIGDLQAQLEAGTPIDVTAEVARLDALAATIEAISVDVGVDTPTISSPADPLG